MISKIIKTRGVKRTPRTKTFQTHDFSNAFHKDHNLILIVSASFPLVGHMNTNFSTTLKKISIIPMQQTMTVD